MSLAAATGMGMAAQGRMNGQLGQELGDALLAAVISFGSGLVLLLAALPLSGRMRTGTSRAVAALREGTLRPWQFLGGLAGALFVIGQSVTIVIMGVAMFTVGVVAGQTVSGLFVDKAGLGPSGRTAPTWPRVAGAVLTLLAVGVAVAGDLARTDPRQVWLLVFPLVAGAGMAFQQAFNGNVGVVSGSTFTAALVNFVAGTSALVCVWLVSLALGGGPTAFPAQPVLYLGGLIGVVVIATASLVVPWIGVLVLSLATVTGQLVGSVVLDLLLPSAAGGPRPWTLVGCGLALVAVGLAGTGGRDARARVLEQSGT